MITFELAAYSSVRSSSSSRSSYSSSRSTTISRPSTSGTTKSYSSTRTATAPAKAYTSTRTQPITRANLNTATTVQQRTSVVNNYYSDHYGYHGFYHPFGWGYGGGDFWFWMFMFNHNQYATNQQIIQAQPGNTTIVAADHQSSLWATAGFLLIAIVVVTAFVLLGRWLWRHLVWA